MLPRNVPLDLDRLSLEWFPDVKSGFSGFNVSLGEAGTNRITKARSINGFPDHARFGFLNNVSSGEAGAIRAPRSLAV